MPGTDALSPDEERDLVGFLQTFEADFGQGWAPSDSERGPVRDCPDCHDLFLPDPEHPTTRCHDCEQKHQPRGTYC